MKAKILIVEDEVAIALGLQLLLEERGHKVRIAENGEDGLRKSIKERPDILITDIKMPVMDGIDLIRSIRNEPSLSGLPIVVVTTSPSWVTEEGIENVRVLEKPLGFEETVDAIEEAIEAIKSGQKFSVTSSPGDRA